MSAHGVKSTGPCAVEGCTRGGRLHRGWCQTHYQRWRKHSDVHAGEGARIDGPLEARLAARTNKLPGVDACWEWTGSRDQQGYGHITANGRTRAAHRVAWELANGQPVPPVLVVSHRCDNPPCIRPSHLSAVRQIVNVADMDAKGRRGLNGRVKVGNETVVAIRRAVADGQSMKALACEYGVAYETIRRIVRGLRRMDVAA